MDCEPFQQDFIVPNNIDYILIECCGSTNTSVIYKDGISFIQQRPDVDEKLQENSKNRRPFGLLLFGIDTVSQFNFRRVMPETFAYVQNDSWYELSGYNKVNKMSNDLEREIRNCLELDIYLNVVLNLKMSQWDRM